MKQNGIRLNAITSNDILLNEIVLNNVKTEKIIEEIRDKAYQLYILKQMRKIKSCAQQCNSYNITKEFTEKRVYKKISPPLFKDIHSYAKMSSSSKKSLRAFLDSALESFVADLVH